ncbi:hypothetical protein ABIA39_004646 [Nocardia sp. GAS34]
MGPLVNWMLSQLSGTGSAALSDVLTAVIHGLSG